MHKARDAYEEARTAFLDEVFALPPPAPPSPPPMPLLPPLVVGREERDRGRTRGRPIIWRRWIEILIMWRGVTYTFTADADSLTLDTSAVETGNNADLCSPDFDPLCAGHSIRFRGIDYAATDPGPAELVKLAIEACRAAALRLHANGIDYFAVTRAWPEQKLAFGEIVKSEPSKPGAR